MKVILTESKANTLIYNFIDKAFASKDGNNEIHRLVSLDEKGVEMKDAYDFVNDDYYSDSGGDHLFTWTGKEYYETLFKHDRVTHREYESLASTAPNVEILDYDILRRLDGYFGHLWRPVFKQWFKDKTGMDYKTLYNIYETSYNI